MTHHPPPRKRLLLVDGSPGATTLLVLAAQGEIPPFDAALIPDTGWIPEQTRRELTALRKTASDAATAWIRAETGDTARDSLAVTVLPLPLFTLTADGVAGRVPQGCARRQGVALSGAVRRLLGYPRPTLLPDQVVAECATGTTLDQAQPPPSAGPRYLRFRHPLTDTGWTNTSCIAFLAHHGLPATLDLACIACPLRSNRSWRHLKACDPAAFAEAVAVDATLRHGHPDPVLRGMPPGTEFFLHRDLVPLDQADLEAGTDTGTDRSGCVPWHLLGTPVPGTEQNGDDR